MIVNKNLAVNGDTIVNGTVVANNVIVAGRDMNSEINRLDGRINTAGANAAALASLTPVPTDEDTKWNVAASFGNYHGETAGAVGVFYKPQDNVMFNVRTSFGSSSDDNMVGGGVSVALNKAGSNGLTKQGMMKKIEAQDKEIALLKNVVTQMAQKMNHILIYMILRRTS